MHGTEPRWGVDLQINCEHTRTAYSDYAYLLVTRLEKVHELVRNHLRVSSRRRKDWFDRKVRTQAFEVGDKEYVLNLRQRKITEMDETVQSGSRVPEEAEQCHVPTSLSRMEKEENSHRTCGQDETLQVVGRGCSR